MVYNRNNLFVVSSAEEKLECFLAQIVLLVWMFIFLVLTSSYTANFASMLTVQQLSPAVTDILELQKQGGHVGFHRGSFIESLLEDIGFDRSKLRPLDTPDDFHSALSNGGRNDGVDVLVLEVPYIKLFLAKYCKGYTMVGPIYKSAGFAFVSSTTLVIIELVLMYILNVTKDLLLSYSRKSNTETLP
jgi:ionotropic glutamate receptor